MYGKFKGSRWKDDDWMKVNEKQKKKKSFFRFDDL